MSSKTPKIIQSESSFIIVPRNYSDTDIESFFRSIKKDKPNFRDWEYPFKESKSNVLQFEQLLDGEFKFITFNRHVSISQSESFSILFSTDINHNYLSESTYFLDENFCEPMTAGFVSISEGNLTVHGCSESLDIDSQPENDIIILNTLLNLG